MGRGRGLRRIGIVSAVLAALTLGAAAPSASAGERHKPVTLAALGDSYSSGVGTPDPDPSSLPTCYRTPHAWPNLVAAALDWRVTKLACSGAATQDITAPHGGPGAPTAPLPPPPPPPGGVTLTNRGNHLG